MGNLDPGSMEEFDRFERYAIYFAPRSNTVLSRCARTWFATQMEERKAEQNSARPDWIEQPSRYRFHATLKAPMRLNPGLDAEDLSHALEEFAQHSRPVSLGPLTIARIGSFLALVPNHSNEQLFSFAFDCVRRFDSYRAPLTEQEILKRGKLTPNQQSMLERWGYPFVGPQFRFHMTLTSSLADDQLSRAMHCAEQCFNPALQEAITLDNICLFGDPGSGQRFRLLQRFDLKETGPSR